MGPADSQEGGRGEERSLGAQRPPHWNPKRGTSCGGGGGGRGASKACTPGNVGAASHIQGGGHLIPWRAIQTTYHARHGSMGPGALAIGGANSGTSVLKADGSSARQRKKLEVVRDGDGDGYRFGGGVDVWDAGARPSSPWAWPPTSGLGVGGWEGSKARCCREQSPKRQRGARRDEDTEGGDGGRWRPGVSSRKGENSNQQINPPTLLAIILGRTINGIDPLLGHWPTFPAGHFK